VKVQEREADHSSASSAEVKNGGAQLLKSKDNFTFTLYHILTVFKHPVV
jgi:hypothetical protein